MACVGTLAWLFSMLILGRLLGCLDYRGETRCQQHGMPKIPTDCCVMGKSRSLPRRALEMAAAHTQIQVSSRRVVHTVPVIQSAADIGYHYEQLPYSCLCPPNAEIIGICHHALLYISFVTTFFEFICTSC